MTVIDIAKKLSASRAQERRENTARIWAAALRIPANVRWEVLEAIADAVNFDSEEPLLRLQSPYRQKVIAAFRAATAERSAPAQVVQFRTAS